MDLPPITLVVLVLFGAVLGSHFGVWADRWPRGEDVLAAPSRCRGCAVRLRWREMVPVMSWLALGGRCAACGRPLRRYLLVVELLCAGAPLLVVPATNTAAEALLGTAFFWGLIGLAVCDSVAYRLPDPLLTGLALVAAGMALEHPARDLSTGAQDGAVCFALAWGLAALYGRLRGREGLGFGDVKLFGVLGLALGGAAMPLVALAAALGGLLAALVRTRSRRRLRAAAAVPFGAWLCIAAAGVWWGIG